MYLFLCSPKVSVYVFLYLFVCSSVSYINGQVPAPVKAIEPLSIHSKASEYPYLLVQLCICICICTCGSICSCICFCMCHRTVLDQCLKFTTSLRANTTNTLKNTRYVCTSRHRNSNLFYSFLNRSRLCLCLCLCFVSFGFIIFGAFECDCDEITMI